MAEFEESCPYFRPASLDPSSQTYRPMFRLEERFSECVPVFIIVPSKSANHESSFSIYKGDSYGDRSYIDISMTRGCSKECRCRDPGSGDFAFEVRKTEHDINIRLNSFMLKFYVPSVYALGDNLRSRFPDSIDSFFGDTSVPFDVIDGFLLLKNIDLLESRLRELRTEMQDSSPSHSSYMWLVTSNEQRAQLEAELSLLVEGLVADDQAFESFGYENLYEKGFLTYDRWKSFQDSKTSRSLDQLDRATHNSDQLEDDEDFDEMVSDDPAGLFQTSHSMPSVPFLGITGPQDEVREPVNDRNSPLIAAIYMGRNDVVSELLARRANPMILSHIMLEDQWHVAQSLLDHGVNATSLFESTHGFEHVDPRLLYVLMERGANIHSSWPASTQRSPTNGLHVSDHEIQEVNSMRAHNFQLLGAIQRGDLACAEEQISHGADPTFGIDSALVGGRWEILRLLLRKGADPRVLKFGKPTVYLQGDALTDACLLTVAEEGLPAVVKSLLHSRGCDKMVAEGLRRPSLTKLIQYDRTHILRMLLQKGVFSRDYGEQ